MSTKGGLRGVALGDMSVLPRSCVMPREVWAGYLRVFAGMRLEQMFETNVLVRAWWGRLQVEGAAVVPSTPTRVKVCCLCSDCRKRE